MAVCRPCDVTQEPAPYGEPNPCWVCGSDMRVVPGRWPDGRSTPSAPLVLEDLLTAP